MFNFKQVEAPGINEYLKSGLHNSLNGSLYGLSQCIRSKFGMGFGLPMRNVGLNYLMFKLRQHLFPNLSDSEAQAAFVELFNQFLQHADKLNSAIEEPLQRMEHENRELVQKCHKNISFYMTQLSKPARLAADLEERKKRKKKDLENAGLDAEVIEQALQSQFKIWETELENQLKFECEDHERMRLNLQKLQQFVKTLDKSLLEGIQL